MNEADRTLLAVGAIAAGLVPRQTRVLAGVAGAIVISRAHGAARRRDVEKAYRDFETYVEKVIARHRGGLVDRVDDIDNLLVSLFRNTAPGTADGVRALERIRERAHDRIAAHYAQVRRDLDAEFGDEEAA